MKKILFTFGLALITAWSVANVYTYDEGTSSYLYTGEPVKTFSVDFTTWETSVLPNEIHDADGATEVNNMAFVKWMIANRSIQMIPGESAVKKNVAFNTGRTNDSPEVKNDVSNNKPRIYLPTTANGVKEITAHMAVASTSSRGLLIYYKDENHPNWTYVSNQAISITTTTKYDVAEATYELNTVGKTSIYLQYNSADYFCVLDIALDIEPIEYAYNETTQRYDYIGEPLEGTFVVDFTQLPTYKKAFNTTLDDKVHADTCLEFEHVGLYKWSHNLEDRSCEGTTYTNVLSNYGNSDVNNTKTGNNNAALVLKPTIYLPTMKNGISKIIVEGWTNGADKNKIVYLIGKDVDGSWKNVKEIDPLISTNEITLKGNTYTKETLEINNRHIKDVAIYRSSTEYQFITKITVIPMEPVEPEYVFNTATGRYDYVGEPIEGEETFVVDFSELTPYDVKYNPNLEANTFADELVEFQHLGLYKYGYTASATCQSVDYAPILWNSGKSDYQGEKKTNYELYKAEIYNKLPSIYFPTFKNGIKQIIVEGWFRNNSRGINFKSRNEDGTWSDIMDETCPHASSRYVSLKKDEYTTATIDVNSNNVKTLCTWVNCNDYQYINKITIIPMGNNEVVIDENEDNEAVLTAYKDQTVNLTVYRSLKANIYNTFCLPGEVTLANFRTAIDDIDCESRWFNEANISNGSLNLIFSPNTSKIQAGFPYLIKPTKDITEPIRLENVEIKYTTGRNIAKPSNDNALVKFFSTLSPKDLAADENCLVLSGDNTLYFVDEAVTMKGMRGYFMLYKEAARAVKANKMPMRAIFPPPSSPADIEPIKDNKQCYKYIENGQLIIHRNGVKYSIDGQIIK